ncbi:hypothetical protein HKX48_000977 [Thoreauomyces humboldtii]|nr:hypothetical protein HKX48_000977 [Thoreauomyces humboldtii]
MVVFAYVVVAFLEDQGEDGETAQAEANKLGPQVPQPTKSTWVPPVNKELPLKVGSTIPGNLQVVNQNGEKLKLLELVKDKGGVFFIYPKADTPGCTIQANGFKDKAEEFKERNYNVFGLSGDKPSAQAQWHAKMSLPYDLLSDESFASIKLFGAYNPTKTVRSHVIIEKGGRIAEIKNQVTPTDSFEDACKFVKHA